MTTSLINESIDQALSIQELAQANGGVKDGGCIRIPTILPPFFPVPWPDPRDIDTKDSDASGGSTQPSDQSKA